MSPAAVSEKPVQPLLAGLTSGQERVLRSGARRLLVLGQSGCGGTEALARRVACWVRSEGIPAERIAALAPSEAAAERLLLRIRAHADERLGGRVAAADADATLASGQAVSVRTPERLAFELLKELGEGRQARLALIGDGALFALAERCHDQLRLESLRELWRLNRVHAMRDFLAAHRLLQRFDLFDARAPGGEPPASLDELSEWCAKARLEIDLGSRPLARAFADSSARLHALLASQGLIDGATAEFELLRMLRADSGALARARERVAHIAVEHVEDLTPSQLALISLLAGEEGRLLALGDARQAIERARGGRVELLISLRDELESAADGEVIELQESVRATPMLCSLANEWARTYSPSGSELLARMEPAPAEVARGEPAGLEPAPAEPAGLEPAPAEAARGGAPPRADWRCWHLAAVRCEDCEHEAEWVAETIASLVDSKEGAWHDLPGGGRRRIGPRDVAVVLRSWSSANAFLAALHGRGVPAVLEGYEIFSQPEVLAVLAALLRATGHTTIPGSFGELSLQGHATKTLGCEPEPVATVKAACELMAKRGLALGRDAARRLLRAAERLEAELGSPQRARRLALGAACRDLSGELRLTGATEGARAPSHVAALCHLAALERLARSVQLPRPRGGRRDRGDFEAEVLALAAWAPRGARAFEGQQASLPPAVKVIPPERCRGRSFAAVFFVDLRAHVLPSKVAKRPPRLPFDGEILERIDPRSLADDDSLHGERNVMHIAFTRSERYLFLTSAGRNRSSFWRWVEQALPEVGGVEGGASEIDLEL